MQSIAIPKFWAAHPFPVLSSMLRAMIRFGQLTIIDARGRIRNFGDPRTGPSVTLRFKDPSLSRRLVLNPSLAFGEAYMDGRLTIERGTLRDFLLLASQGLARLESHPVQQICKLFQRSGGRRNPLSRSRANVAHHYDLSGALYDLFLDADRQYSCAYFETGDETLEEAQMAKKRHLAAKLLLKPGNEVLDIGCGWGGLALHLAQSERVKVTGITLSTEQLGLARSRAVEMDQASNVRFEMRDFREEKGRYDRIVSVGMFEHVGRPNYQTFFTTCARLLKDDGVMLLHSIGRSSGAGTTNPWITKYIFPGGYIPGLSEVLPYIERAGLMVMDTEILRLHYAETCKEWRKRFRAQWDEIAQAYDEPFCRMFDFYLAGSESTFRHRKHMVFHLQLAKRIDAVPITRDYLYGAAPR